MRQLKGDIVLVEGNNELNIQMIPVVPSLADLYGMVIDTTTDEPIADAVIILEASFAPFPVSETKTDISGNYSFINKAIGDYVITIEKEGYQPAVQQVALYEGTNKLDVELAPVVPPGAVTIDRVEVQVDYATYRVNTKVTITNNTGETLISRPGDWIYTKLTIDAYAGERYSQILGDPPKIKEPGDGICTLFSTTAAGTGSSIGDIPPGTTIKSVSYDARDLGLQYYDRASHTNKRLPLEYGLPEGLEGYIAIRFYQVDQRGLTYTYGAKVTELFKGVFSSQWQAWTRPSYHKEKRWIPPHRPIPWVYIPGYWADIYTVDGLEFRIRSWSDP